MKKTYMVPSMQVIAIQHQHLICGSNDVVNSFGSSPEGFVFDDDGLIDSEMDM